MKARLISLQAYGATVSKPLASALLKFGEITTFVLGDNGAGKTPLIRMLAYSLGHTLELPPDILARVGSVEARLRRDDLKEDYIVRRQIGPAFVADIVTNNAPPVRYYDQKLFAERMHGILPMPPRDFASKRDSSSVPGYMNMLAPVYYVDQDNGWKKLYSPLETGDYVKSQRQEVVRWILNVSPKHRATDPKAFEKAKSRAHSLDEQIAIKRQTIAALKREMIGTTARGDSLPELLARRESMRASLLRTSTALREGGTVHISAALSAERERFNALQRQLASGERRLRELNALREGYTAELDILGTNETAAEAFRSLCASTLCQFFLKPEDSYGRRLLYLKDQIKDFELAFGSARQQVDEIREEALRAESAVGLLENARSDNAGNDSAALIAEIEALTGSLSDLNVTIDRHERIQRELVQLEALVDRLSNANDQVELLRPTGGGRRTDTHAFDMRRVMGGYLCRWLQILEVENATPQDVLNDDFLPVLNMVPFTPGAFSGSTLTRIVLAYHAALVETSIRHGGHHPAFLLLDAPKQQELESAHLRAFIGEFYKMSRDLKCAIQLVVGAKDEDIIPPDAVDKEWRPTFRTEQGKLRHLGPK